jgi:hypothetical protein
MITFALALMLAPDPDPPADLGWLVGEWCTEKAEGRKTTCESWRAAGNGGLRGMGKTWHERFVTIDEHMEIRPEGDGLVFHAEPNRQKPTAFRSVGGQPAMSLRFENRAHDYPQVVRYWREGALLMAEISLADGSKPMRWTYHRKE